MKFDRKGSPYRNLFDQFLSSDKKLARAISKNDVDLVVALIKNKEVPLNYRLSSLERPQGLSSQTDNGGSLMHWLVARNSFDGVECLLEQGQDPNIRTFFKETPAHWAASDGNEDMLVLLFAHGADFELCQSQRGSFVFEDPYCPNVFQLFKTKTGKEWTKEDFSAHALKKNIESNISQSAPSRLRKM